MGFVFFSILLSLLRKLENVSHAYIWINKWTFKGERSWMTFEMWYFFVIYFGTIFSFNAFTSKLRGNVFKWMRDATSTKSRKEQEILCYYACSMGHCKRCYHANFLLHPGINHKLIYFPTTKKVHLEKHVYFYKISIKKHNKLAVTSVIQITQGKTYFDVYFYVWNKTLVDKLCLTDWNQEKPKDWNKKTWIN